MSFKSNLVVALLVFVILFIFCTVAACACLKNLAPEIRLSATKLVETLCLKGHL